MGGRRTTLVHTPWPEKSRHSDSEAARGTCRAACAGGHVLRHELARGHHGSARRDDQHTAAPRIGQCGAQSLDGLAVDGTAVGKVGKVVDKGQVQDGVGARGRLPEQVQVLDRAAQHFRALLLKLLGALVTACKAENGVASVQQLFDNSRADEACGSGNKDFHFEIFKEKEDLWCSVFNFRNSWTSRRPARLLYTSQALTSSCTSSIRAIHISQSAMPKAELWLVYRCAVKPEPNPRECAD